MKRAMHKIDKATRTGAETTLPRYAIETAALTKIYRARTQSEGITALDAVDLVVPRGAIFGLLGPNGAGKSTLINILAGLTVKTAGTARIWDHDIDSDTRRARSAIGVVMQEIYLDAFFTPREVMEIQAGLYGVPKAERRTMEILEIMGLADKADAWPRSLSGGMKRRLLVAKAMVHSPPVIILDEPTAGVDVELRRQLWAYMGRLNDGGTTILLTTHYLEEAEALCDTIAIINHGRIIACDTAPALVRLLDQRALSIVVTGDMDAVPPTLMRFGAELVSPRRITFRFSPSRTAVGEILEAVRAAGLEIADLATEDGDLEDIFLQLTGLDNNREGTAGETPDRPGADDVQAETVARSRTRPNP